MEALLAFSKTGIMNFFHTAGNACVDILRLKVNFSTRAEISELPFTAKLGIPSNLTVYWSQLCNLCLLETHMLGFCWAFKLHCSQMKWKVVRENTQCIKGRKTNWCSFINNCVKPGHRKMNRSLIVDTGLFTVC